VIEFFDRRWHQADLIHAAAATPLRDQAAAHPGLRPDGRHGGRNDFSELNGFHSKSPRCRGSQSSPPARPANFLVAILLITGLGLTQLNSDAGKVLSVVRGSPAVRSRSLARRQHSPRSTASP